MVLPRTSGSLLMVVGLLVPLYSAQADETQSKTWIEVAKKALSSFDRVVDHFPNEERQESFSDFEATVFDRLKRWLSVDDKAELAEKWKLLKDSLLGLELFRVEDGLEGRLYFLWFSSAQASSEKQSSIRAITFFCHQHDHDGKRSLDCHFKSLADAEVLRIKMPSPQEDRGHGSKDFTMTSKAFLDSFSQALRQSDFVESKEEIHRIKSWNDRNDIRIVVTTTKPTNWISYCHFHKDGKVYCHAASRRGSNEPEIVSSLPEKGSSK